MDKEAESTGPSPELAGPALGQGLEPFLREACDQRLGPVTWFRTDWQHGGAATGRARLELDDGTSIEVVVKLPVSLTELRWLQRLQDAPDPLPIPRLLRCGLNLGGYDLAWVVIEWLPHGPLGTRWHDAHIQRTCEAAAAFHAAAADFKVDRDVRVEDWSDLLSRSRQAIRTQAIIGANRWKTAQKTLSRKLDTLVTLWRAREPIGWLHGDLHLANAMARQDINQGEVCLIDLAEVRPGHWVEDAVYLERLHWARPARLKNNAPLKHLARARKDRGLEVGSDYPLLADIRRALYAATAPAFLRTEGGAHLDASLEHLEHALERLR